MKRKLLVIYLLVLLVSIAKAQPDTLADQPVPVQSQELFLTLIHQMQDDSVVLRWAPSRIDGWITGMNNGYTIQKLELDADMEPVGEWDTLVTDLILPHSVEDFKTEIANNPEDIFLAAAAESMYGFQMEYGDTYGNNAEGKSIFDLAEEYQDRFAICLLSADLSARGASGLGWRWVDKKIKPNTRYVYRVYVPGEDSLALSLDASLIAERDSYRLEAPIVADILEKEGQVDLRLSRDINDRYFSAYYIEKSTNNRLWTRLNDVPFVQPLTDHKIGNKEFIIYRDTALVNYTPHWYRVVGITAFGEITKPSTATKAMGRDRTPPRIPDRMMAKMNEDLQMEIQWEYDEEPDDIKGFILARSKRPFDPQTPVHEYELPAGTRSYIDLVPSTLAHNFYTLYVLDTASNVTYTQATFGSYIDSMPPAPPTGITYEIDSSGHTIVKWDVGPEEDLLGYHVYFGNSKGHYLTNVTKLVLQDTIFRDTFDLNSLTETAYFRVTALDFNYNVSDYSEWLEVVKPDIVPPSSPVITDHKYSDKGIEILYEQSSSKDVVGHILYRQKEDDTWKEVDRVDGHQPKGMLADYDDALVPGKLYRYRVAAIDDAGNISKPTFNYTARTKLPVIAGEIESFEVEEADKKAVLSWSYIGREDDVVRVYRSTAGKDFQLIRSYDAALRKGSDYTFRNQQDVEYRITLVTRDGQSLDMSEVKRVEM